MCCTTAYGQSDYSVVFLSIGVEHYAKPEGRRDSPSAIAFSNPPSGAHSANRVAYQLAQRSAVWGLKLVDDPNHLITREDIWGAVNEAASAASQLENPLLVVYYNGHGLGEGLGFGHFLIPGDFVGPYPFIDLVDAEEHQVVSVLGILELIANAGLPYLVLLDTCYDADEQTFKNTMAPDVEELGRSVTNILRALNSQYAAVTASEPTSGVQSLADPNPRLSHKTIGPLARRLLITMDQLGSGEIPVQALVDRLASASLDTETQVARVQPPDHSWLGLLPAVGEPASFKTRLGTGMKANFAPLDSVIAEEKQEEEEGQSTQLQLTPQPRYAKVALKAGSFGANRPASFGQINDDTDIVFSTHLRNAADFSTADSDVSSFSYDFPRNMIAKLPSAFSFGGVDRFDDRPGVGLSFRGMTCDVASGEASNVIATFQSDVLQTLSMNFSVVCSNGVTAEGTMDVVW